MNSQAGSLLVKNGLLLDVEQRRFRRGDILLVGGRIKRIGEALEPAAGGEVLDAAGMPDIQKVLPIVFSPGNRVYYGVGASLGHAFAVGKEI